MTVLLTITQCVLLGDKGLGDKGFDRAMEILSHWRYNCKMMVQIYCFFIDK